jgi:hypothetical protein
MREKVRNCQGDKTKREKQVCSEHLESKSLTPIVQDGQAAVSVCVLAIVHTFQSSSSNETILILISMLGGGPLIVSFMIHWLA